MRAVREALGVSEIIADDLGEMESDEVGECVFVRAGLREGEEVGALMVFVGVGVGDKVLGGEEE